MTVSKTTRGDFRDIRTLDGVAELEHSSEMADLVRYTLNTSTADQLVREAEVEARAAAGWIDRLNDELAERG